MRGFAILIVCALASTAHAQRHDRTVSGDLIKDDEHALKMALARQ